MTTIAYRDGVIAYDSRMTRGDLIVSDTYDKCIQKDDYLFIGYGDVESINKLIHAYLTGEIKEPIESNALVYDEKNINLIHIGFDPTQTPKNLWNNPLDLNEYYAFGSGEEHAITAMDMGASAYEAVKMAIKRNCCSGGIIRKLHIKKEK